MLVKFWEGVSGKLAETWAAQVLSPAFVFWAGGLGAWLLSQGPEQGISDLEVWLTARSPSTRSFLLVGALLLVAFSGLVVQRFDLTMLRLLEGYWRWPLRALDKPLVFLHRKWSQHNRERLRVLAAVGIKNMNRAERAEYVRRDLRALRMPTDPKDLMPTGLGNVLRAAERRPNERYGLDAVVCWPPLWLVLPEEARRELQTARASVDSSVRAATWSALFAVWSIFTPWAGLASAVSLVASYFSAVSSAVTFAELLQAAFHVHRKSLLTALRWPLPRNPTEEEAIGQAVTTFLWRGSDADTPAFTN